MSDDSTRISEEDCVRVRMLIEEGTGRLKDELNRLLDGEFSEDEQKRLHSSITATHSVTLKSGKKKSKVSDSASTVVDKLGKGEFSGLTIGGESKASGTLGEALSIGLIQWMFVEDQGIEGTLRKRESPDLPDINIDVKTSTKKKGGIATSTSSKSGSVVHAYQQRFTGISHDILLFRFENDRCSAVAFINGEGIVDRKAVARLKKILQILPTTIPIRHGGYRRGHGFSHGGKPIYQPLRTLEGRELLEDIIHFLTLTRENEETKEAYTILDTIIHQNYGYTFHKYPKVFRNQMEFRLQQGDFDEKEFNRLMKLGKKDLLSEFKDNRTTMSFIRIEATKEVFLLNLNEEPSKLLSELTPVLRFFVDRHTRIDSSTVDRMIGLFGGSEEEGKGSITDIKSGLTTKGFELVINFNISDLNSEEE